MDEFRTFKVQKVKITLVDASLPTRSSSLRFKFAFIVLIGVCLGLTSMILSRSALEQDMSQKPNLWMKSAIKGPRSSSSLIGKSIQDLPADPLRPRTILDANLVSEVKNVKEDVEYGKTESVLVPKPTDHANVEVLKSNTESAPKIELASAIRSVNTDSEPLTTPASRVMEISTTTTPITINEVQIPQQTIEQSKLMPQTNPKVSVDKLVEGRMWYDNHFITLVTQFTIDREEVFQQIIDAWPGPISACVAIHMDNANEKAWDPLEFLARPQNLLRDNIQINIFDITGTFKHDYPINTLRNFAWSFAITPFVFLLDVDFVPTGETYSNLINSKILNYYVTNVGEVPTERLAVVVPAFRAPEVLNEPIADKQDLLRLYNDSKVEIFSKFTNAHAPSNFLRWQYAEESFCTEPIPKHEYEPFMVVPWYAEKYDENYRGYSKNKKSHTLFLLMTGWSFIVSHNTAVVHMPHPRSDAYREIGMAQNKETWKSFTYDVIKDHSHGRAACRSFDWSGLVDPVTTPYRYKKKLEAG